MNRLDRAGKQSKALKESGNTFWLYVVNLFLFVVLIVLIFLYSNKKNCR